MLELTASDPIVKTYLKDLQHLKDQNVVHELGLKAPFHNLLDKAAKKRGWHLVSELSMQSGDKRIVPDGTVRDSFSLPRGWWEAKDTTDNLASEIQKKLKAGYPASNTIFEDTQRAVLFQDREPVGEYALLEPVRVADLLNSFFNHDEAHEREFSRAMAQFKDRIPGLAQYLRDRIDEGHKNNLHFRKAFAEFVTLCRASLNPDLSDAKVDEMLIQHLLTERLMRNLFQNPEFTRKNAIAAQVEQVIDALAKGSFSRAGFLKDLDPFYKAIEREGSNLSHFTQKQDFLNSVYEQFFQRFSPDIADTHGIVYTPREIVDYMCKSVEDALKQEFGLTLASPEVVILDPCTGTGNFIVRLMDRMPRSALAEAYKNRLFANEVMLLPYYIASLNIEHAYSEHLGGYEPFEGLCFVDTLDMAEHPTLFAPENTKRVERERRADITIIIGNPPYNVGQESENDNNKNRKYKVVDKDVSDTYTKSSKATNKNALSDVYVKFFRWATDRLKGRDGIVCFVSNNSFVDQTAFDGMRKHLSQDFERIDHVDLHGNVRRNPKLSGTTHNVFGIQVGVGITLAVKKKGAAPQLRYYRVPEMWRKSKKLEFLASHKVPWQILTPDAKNTWLVAEHADEWSVLQPIDELFALHSNGVKTNRDAVVYDWNSDKLAARVKQFIHDYNAEVHRHKSNPNADWPDHVNWSRDLKQDAVRGRLAEFEQTRIVRSLYRPFTKRWLYLDRVLNEEVYQWSSISGWVIAMPGLGNRKPFGALASDTALPLDLAFEKAQCFPLSHLKASALTQFRTHYATNTITKEEIFHYIYALLHHPEYRTRYAANLKRELPRIPFAPDFQAFAAAGKELARLHVDYESLTPWPLKEIENKDVPYTQRVTKMKLSKDKQFLYVNDSLTFSYIPPETFDYRLGSRSALEWIVDQYQIKGESDPNREEDPGYIIRLIGQVVRVSIETAAIVKALPAFLPETLDTAKSGD
jgi:predicted helicase